MRHIGIILILVLYACNPEDNCGITSIALPGDEFFPEGISIDSQGTIYVGSIATGAIAKTLACNFEAEYLVPPGIYSAIIGTLVDEEAQVLWACHTDFSGQNEPQVVGVDLNSGQQLAQHTFENGGFCNDLALDTQGNLYATDSMAHRVMRIAADQKLTNSPAEIWSDDPIYSEGLQAGQFGLNGLVWDNDLLYIVNFQLGQLLRVSKLSNGDASQPELISSGLTGPDGIERLKPGVFLVVEAGLAQVSRITIEPQVTIQSILDGFDVPTTIDIFEDRVWVVESQSDHFFDRNLPDPNLPHMLTSFSLNP